MDIPTMLTVALAGVTVVVTMEGYSRRLERRIAALEEKIDASPEHGEARDDAPGPADADALVRAGEKPPRSRNIAESPVPEPKEPSKQRNT
jgi:hypothetical protein